MRSDRCGVLPGPTTRFAGVSRQGPAMHRPAAEDMRPALVRTRAGDDGRRATATAAVRSPHDLDTLLVLAIDSSGSLTDDRLAFQRDGYARAVTAAPFLAAIRKGPAARVALAAVEWSSNDRQTLTVPWSVIEDAASARRFAERLLEAPRPIPGFTAIGAAIDYAVRLLAREPAVAPRRVVDVSGNGRNNDGRAAAEARDAALAAGVTVNGLPILDIDETLDSYYAEDVVGGPGAFVVVARDLHSFADAVLRKMVYEITTAPPVGTAPG